MARRAPVVLLAAAVLAGCGGHSGPPPTFERLLTGHGSAHFAANGTVELFGTAPVHVEGNVSGKAVTAGGTAVEGRRLSALRALLEHARWTPLSGRRARVELDLTRADLERVAPGEVPAFVPGAHVTATVMLSSLNLQPSNEGG